VSTRLAALLFLGGLALVFSPTVHGEVPLSRTERVLWTTCTITLCDHPSEGALASCFDRLHEIERRMGTGVPGSEVEAINAAAGKQAVPVSDDLFFLTGKALSVARLSGGLFDLTVGPLIEAWRMNRDSPDIPPKKQIVGALALIDWHDVVRDEKAKTIFLERPSMRLDLGGFIKGYAADETVRIFSGYGVTSALIDLGGNIFAMGTSPSGSPWKIGIQSPDQARGVFLAIVQVTGGSVVTAGVYEHYFVKKGRRYHHIMDIRSGFPVENGLLSVTVIADTSTYADAFDTALLVIGKTHVLRLAEKLGLNVVMVDDHHRVWVTPGTKRILTITDPTYSYAN